MNIVPLFLVALLLTGCTTQPAQSVATSEQSGAPVAHDTPAAIETSTPTPIPAATTAVSVITTAGYGPLVLGEPVPPNNGVVEYDPQYCGDTVAEPGEWIGRTGSPTSYPGIAVVREGRDIESPITRVLVTGEQFLTRSGAHVGMTESQVVTIYPDAEGSEPFDGAHLMRIADPLGTVTLVLGAYGSSDLNHFTVYFIDVTLPGDDYFSFEERATGQCEE